MGALDDLKDHGGKIFKAGLTDDSRIHLLNRLYCVVVLIVFVVIVSAKQYVGEPIQCWCPAVFEKSHVAYTNNYCWVSNTYYVDFESSLPIEREIRVDKEIEYYQWVPLIFLLQALLFYMPRMVWKRFGGGSYINVKQILRRADEAVFMTHSERDEALNDIVMYLDKYIKVRNCISSPYKKMEKVKTKMANAGVHYGNYLCFLFMVTSFLYLANAVAQIILVDAFLGNDFKTLGFHFLKSLFSGKSFEDHLRFPRVTFCDLDVRQMTNVQTWTVQCSLPINLFNEKIFCINWMMLVSMVLINGTSFLYNLVAIFLPFRNRNYVRKFLDMEGIRDGRPEESPEYEETLQHNFVFEYLRHDGVFLIWFVSNKTNQVIASEIVIKLWKNYVKSEKFKEQNKGLGIEMKRNNEASNT
ncbi:inx [Mytilus coruscus]|uniref:Innexin n=1 Tax=Mytilus coruscus TaxID=42192 RepID=A0A6J8AWM1_MYTCO|nr:inx [Mytilus coruscus]